MNTIVVIGDSFSSLIGPGVKSYSSPALSANDSFLAQLIQKYAPTNQPFFLSPGNEFHGVRKAQEIIEKMILPCEQRLIQHSSMETRMCRAFMKYSDESTREKLLTNYLEMVDYWMVKCPNMILAPLASYRYTNFLKVGLIKSYHHFQDKYKARMVNLDQLPVEDPTLWSSDTIHLSNIGMNILIEEMRRML